MPDSCNSNRALSPRQFGIRHLFGATFVCSIFFALFPAAGFLAGTMLAGAAVALAMRVGFLALAFLTAALTAPEWSPAWQDGATDPSFGPARVLVVAAAAIGLCIGAHMYRSCIE